MLSYLGGGSTADSIQQLELQLYSEGTVSHVSTALITEVMVQCRTVAGCSPSHTQVRREYAKHSKSSMCPRPLITWESPQTLLRKSFLFYVMERKNFELGV